MPQPFKESNPESTLKNTYQPNSGLHPISGRCEALISGCEVLLTSLIIRQMSRPGPLYMPQGFIQLLKNSCYPFCHLAMAKKSEIGTQGNKWCIVRLNNKNYQQAACVGALRAADMNASLALAAPPQWGDSGVASSVSLADRATGNACAAWHPALHLYS